MRDEEPDVRSDADGLRAEDVGVRGREASVLSGVSLHAAPGRMVAVTGSSGSGKTTLLSVLGGLLAPDAGTATYDRGPVGTTAGEPRAGTALVLQTYGLVPSLTAAENVVVALRARGWAPAEAGRLAVEALDRVLVGNLSERLVTELSGGQLQRVAVARALAVVPDVLLADEPTSELDEHHRDLVVAELREEAKRGAAVVLATHDPEVAALCDDEVHLVDGEVARPAAPAPDLGPGHEHDLFKRPS